MNVYYNVLGNVSNNFQEVGLFKEASFEGDLFYIRLLFMYQSPTKTDTYCGYFSKKNTLTKQGGVRACFK